MGCFQYIKYLIFQETEGQKTNNGIQYRLQLLYANGKFLEISFVFLLFINKTHHYVNFFEHFFKALVYNYRNIN